MKKTIYTLLLLGGCSAALLQTGCNKKPTDGIKLIVNADVIKYSALVQYKDASGAVIPSTTVTITGADANNVYNIAGKKEYVINGGMLTVGLGPDVTPTKTSPAVFNVVVSAPGYLPVTTQIKMYPDQPQQVVNVSLVNISVPTPGVAFKTATTALANNQLASALTVNTSTSSTGSTSKQSCALTVPTGTQLLDVNGNQLTGSNLSVVMASFDSKSPSSANSFPGGFTADGITAQDGSTISATFMTAGFANITMNLDGTTVKKFSKPMTISMTLDATTINPNTHNPIQAGDSIPVFTYDEGTAKWQFETNSVITSTGGTLNVSYPVSHLTWTNFGWYTTTATCTNSSITISAPGLTGSDNYQMDVTTADGYSVLSTTVAISDGTVIPLNNVPSQTMTVKFTHAGSTDVLGEADNFSACGAVTVTMKVGTAQVITADLIGTCPNKNNQQVRPSFYLYYKTQGAPASDYVLLGYVDKGHISTTALQMGSSYDFMTYYGNDQVTTTQTVTQTQYTENVTLPADVCSSL